MKWCICIEQKQADINTVLLLLSLLCHILPLMFRYAGDDTAYSPNDTLQLSRASSIIMLVAYVAYLFFQLWTHREFFEAQEVLFSLQSSLAMCLLLCFLYKFLYKYIEIKNWCSLNRLAYLCLIGRRWWFGFRRSTSTWILECIYLAGWDDCCYCSFVWVCCWHYWGN